MINSETILAPFDVVTSVHCIEFASSNSEEYQQAIHNVIGLVKPGGYFVYAGLLEKKFYQFGGRRYESHFLTEDEMLSTLEANGIDMPNLFYLQNNTVFIVMGKKKSNFI